MNIFALSDSPHEAAIWQHDRHVVKMILESAQMLSTLAHEKSAFRDLVPPQYLPRLYKSTHVNHPCNVWLRANDANAVWLAMHLDSLLGEYHRRFQKVHATYELGMAFNAVACKLAGVQRMWTRDDARALRVDNAIVDMAANHTPFAVCMPDEFKEMRVNGMGSHTELLTYPVTSYRNLYLESKIFQDSVTWRRCDSLPPFIMREHIAPSTHAQIKMRVDALVREHEAYRARGWLTERQYEEEQQRLARLTNAGIKPHVGPHPDSLKPALPRTFKRFGTKQKGVSWDEAQSITENMPDPTKAWIDSQQKNFK